MSWKKDLKRFVVSVTVEADLETWKQESRSKTGGFGRLSAVPFPVASAKGEAFGKGGCWTDKRRTIYAVLAQLVEHFIRNELVTVRIG